MVLFMIAGCSKQSSEYREFTSKYGKEKKFCEDGTQFVERFISEGSTSPQKYMINSQVCVDKSNTYP